MKTRTLLTTPAGATPVTDAGSATAPERYSAGLAVPSEPSVPHRFRKLRAAAVVLVVLGVALTPVYRWWDQNQRFDPSVPVEGGVQLPDGGEGG